MARGRRFWLMKSEPEVFSIEDLRRADGQTTCWDGVRNYQARNFLRDEIKTGDGVLYYHSNAQPPGIAGEAVVVAAPCVRTPPAPSPAPVGAGHIRAGYPDFTAFDPNDPHYDPKSDPTHPTWYMVDVRFVRACKALIALDRLRSIPTLRSMLVLRRGMRLSVQPVTAREWDVIMALPEWG
jgi:predicted RNA-binding protein with PUA-like domain